MTLTIDKRVFENFLKDYQKNKRPGQRLGQAFYDHFNLGKLPVDSKLYNVFAKDGDSALKCINEITTFT